MTNNHLKVNIAAKVGDDMRDALSTVATERLIESNSLSLSWVIPFDDKDEKSIGYAAQELAYISRAIDDIGPKAKPEASIFRPCDKFDIDVIGDFGV